MAKVIAEKASDVVDSKNIEIKHTKVMKDAAGKDVTVVDNIEVIDLDYAISEAEKDLVVYEAKVTELKEDIVEYKKIKG